MAVLRRGEILAAFFLGMALGILCTLGNKKIEAQEKPQDSKSVKEAVATGYVRELVCSKWGWELWHWRSPHQEKRVYSRETLYYLRDLLDSKICFLEMAPSEFERDYLFEQLGEKGKPKQVPSKIWCVRQALHAVVRAYPAAPPREDRFPELAKELARLPEMARGENQYTLDQTFWTPVDVAGFAKRGDQIYVVWVRSPVRSNQFWVNARTGEVAALFPPRQWSDLRRDVRILLE